MEAERAPSPVHVVGQFVGRGGLQPVAARLHRAQPNSVLYDLARSHLIRAPAVV